MGENREGNIQFIKLKGIKDFEIVIGKNINNIFPVHLHEKYCIGLIEKGNALLTLKNREIVLSTGYIYFINQNDPHQIKPFDHEGFNHIVLCFGMGFINNYFGKEQMENESIRFITPSIYNDDIRNAVLSFLDMLKMETNKLNVEYKMMMLFSEIYKYLSFSRDDILYEGEKSDSILKACSYIKKNYKESLSLQKMAAVAGLSKFHFSRVFKEKIGISPYDFQIQIKIKLARKLLLEGQPAAFTAVELGFCDQSHFTKFFKRNTGVTPLQFVKLNMKI